MAASSRLYNDIAKEISYLYTYAEETDKPVIRRVTLTLATSLKRDNPNFDRERFLKASIGTDH